jgi:uncharacterized protein
LQVEAGAQLKFRESGTLPCQGVVPQLGLGPSVLAKWRCMTLSEIRAQREVLLGIASRHGARNLRLFGSAVRGIAGRDSDIDLLVDLEPGRTLLDLGGLLMEIQGVVGARVDVALERMLRPELRVQVLRETVPL